MLVGRGRCSGRKIVSTQVAYLRSNFPNLPRSIYASWLSLFPLFLPLPSKSGALAEPFLVGDRAGAVISLLYPITQTDFTGHQCEPDSQLHTSGPTDQRRARCTPCPKATYRFA